MFVHPFEIIDTDTEILLIEEEPETTREFVASRRRINVYGFTLIRDTDPLVME